MKKYSFSGKKIGFPISIIYWIWSLANQSDPLCRKESGWVNSVLLQYKNGRPLENSNLQFFVMNYEHLKFSFKWKTNVLFNQFLRFENNHEVEWINLYCSFVILSCHWTWKRPRKLHAARVYDYFRSISFYAHFYVFSVQFSGIWKKIPKNLMLNSFFRPFWPDYLDSTFFTKNLILHNRALIRRNTLWYKIRETKTNEHGLNWVLSKSTRWLPFEKTSFP